MFFIFQYSILHIFCRRQRHQLMVITRMNLFQPKVHKVQRSGIFQPDAMHHPITAMERIYTLTDELAVIFTDDRTSDIIKLFCQKTVFSANPNWFILLAERQG